MLTKPILTLSLLLPLMASTSAYAGSTISDKSYWPSEARKSAQYPQYRTVGLPSDAFAYDLAGSRLQPAMIPSAAGSTWQYRGGPKGR
ncbi:hypothetical protein ACVWXO_004360 [Bradyrhizobium sp. LM2.7]